MIAKILALSLLVFVLVGCSVRQATPEETVKPTLDQSAGSPGTDLDKSNTFLAERTVPMSKLGATLRKIGKFDAHLTWNDEFIKQTLTEASLLKQNERIEGPMFAKANEISAEVQVVIMRVEEDKYAVRAITSNKMVADAIEQSL